MRTCPDEKTTRYIDHFQLPTEITKKIIMFLSQNDLTILVRINKQFYKVFIPYLYKNIYLNKVPYSYRDSEPYLGFRNWSTLQVPQKIKENENGYEETDSKNKVDTQSFRELLRTVKENPTLVPLIEKIHCTWHLNHELLSEFIVIILSNKNNNLTHLENLASFEIFQYIWLKFGNSYNLSKMQHFEMPYYILCPEKGVSNVPQSYIDKLDNLMKPILKVQPNFWQNLTSLNISVNPLFYSRPFMVKLNIKKLVLNIRPEKYACSWTNNDVHYRHVFDMEALEHLELLSWFYEDSYRIKHIYEDFKLYEFLDYPNIKHFELLSMPANEKFLQRMVNTWTKLEAMTLSFAFSTCYSYTFLQNAAFHSKLKILKIEIDQNINLLSCDLVPENADYLVKMRYYPSSCRCTTCNSIYTNIICLKYMYYKDKVNPTSNILLIYHNNSTNGETPDPADKAFVLYDEYINRDFAAHILNEYCIYPHVEISQDLPDLSYRVCDLKTMAVRISERLGLPPGLKLLPDDIVKLSHYMIHAFKKNFNEILRYFPNLDFLVFNGIPLEIREEASQKHCFPLYFSEGYKSNQLYETASIGQDLFS
ncbi:uncharacterized protein SCDLUD_001733 [Saccharomycodes ludwigii]|uniref:uncharacterized protein n=1 Tax=Saccharomycodes ludwigii TaxID=36035 RepID=UPI001E8C594B|nr:hypothetical protein SCDLUD_001733 [Saccharomycodes ludwigii]KAH3901948.1 hypothetical protein SCDLUD_001733 [Saccharomycodes ludwigii]